MGKVKKIIDEPLTLNKKDLKKVSKLESMIPYYEARKQTDEIDKLKSQISAIWDKARDARDAGLA